MTGFKQHKGIVVPSTAPTSTPTPSFPSSFCRRSTASVLASTCSTTGASWTMLVSSPTRVRAQPAAVRRRQHPAGPRELRLRLEPRARPWALADYGFKTIIAPSFADIFYGNAINNGMVPVRLKEEEVEALFNWLPPSRASRSKWIWRSGARR